jgi:S1-C subfamily serine protease
MLLRSALLMAVAGISCDIPIAHGAGGRAERSVEQVKSGTGFFVSRDGYLVTSAHVIGGCEGVSVWDHNGLQSRARILALDRQLDVALLRAEGVLARQSAMISGPPPQPGEKVITLGYGVVAERPLEAVVVEGPVAGSSRDRPGNRIILIRASLHPGNSGGALLAGDGSLFGMIVGLDDERPEFGVAIPTEILEPFLSGYGIRLPRREPARNTRDFLGAISVLIQCLSLGGSAARGAR